MKTRSVLNQLTIAFAIATTVLVSCTKADTTIPIDELVPQSNLPERIIMDTAYGTDPLQKMDIYLPARRTHYTKVIVMIHGGSWIGGDKSEVDNFVQLFRAKWPECAIANINYRLADGNTIKYEQIMEDVKAAVSMMTTNKAAFSISDTLALWGNSAGAHLAMQYTYTKNDAGYVKCVADLYGPSKLDDWTLYNSTAPLNVKQILTRLTGSAWNEALYKSFSPIETVSATSKPTIIFHGNLDFVVPIYQSQWLKNKLDELKVPNEYFEYTDFHGFSYSNNEDCVNKTVAFFKKHM